MSCILGSKSNKARVGERGNFLSRSLNLFRCAASSPLRSAEKSISRRNIARKRRPSLNIFRGNIPDPGPRATIFFSFFFFFLLPMKRSITDSQTNYSRAASKPVSTLGMIQQREEGNGQTYASVSTNIKIIFAFMKHWLGTLRVVFFVETNHLMFASILKREKRLRS